jgi:glucokinase
MARYGGIDLGGTKIQAVVVDDAHEVLGSARHPTPTRGGPADVALAMLATLREAADQAGLGAGDLTAVGVGSPGVVDEEAGTVTSARNLPAWEGSYPLKEKLEAALHAPVGISNDVNVATNAEFELGAAKPFRSILGVFWGTGVGGGVVLDGELWEGRGGAGEIGHMVVKSDGRVCPCGRIGCMEAYAGRGAMEARAREKVAEGEKTILFEIMEERGKPRLSSGIWARALERDDKLAHHLVDKAVDAIGVAWACGSGSPMSSASAPRSCRTCSPTTGRPRCCWPRWATSAGRSARPCLPRTRHLRRSDPGAVSVAVAVAGGGVPAACALERATRRPRRRAVAAAAGRSRASSARHPPRRRA